MWFSPDTFQVLRRFSYSQWKGITCLVRVTLHREWHCPCALFRVVELLCCLDGAGVSIILTRFLHSMIEAEVAPFTCVLFICYCCFFFVMILRSLCPEEDDARLPSCCSLWRVPAGAHLPSYYRIFVPHFRHHSAIWLRLFFLEDWFFLPKCVLCLCRLWDPFLIDPFLQCFHYLFAFTLKRTCSNNVSRINGMKVSVTYAFPACVHFQVSMVTA